jgi:hypothetical protein
MSSGLAIASEKSSLFDRTEKSGFGWKKLIAKVVAGSAAVIFGLAILMLSLLAASNPERVSPNTQTLKQAKVEVAEEVATAPAMVIQKTQYYLPYPGILPDSPLYKIKAIRDQISLLLTPNGEQKAKKQLLFADKRINAAQALIDGGKKDLGVTTATKAEKYLEQAVTGTEVLLKKGTDAKSLLLELGNATTKHVEMLEGQMGQTEGDNLKSLQTTLKTTKMLQEKVKQMILDLK